MDQDSIEGVTDLSIFHPYMLGIKPPSQLYLEGHAGNYLNSVVRGDPIVKEALAIAVEREETLNGKSSTLCESRDIFTEVRSVPYQLQKTLITLILLADTLSPHLRSKLTE